MESSRHGNGSTTSMASKPKRKRRRKAAHATDPERRTCVIDGSTRVGQHLNRLFVGFLRREFGETAFNVSVPST